MRRLVIAVVLAALALLPHWTVVHAFTITRVSRVETANTGPTATTSPQQCAATAHTAGNLLVLITQGQDSGAPAFPTAGNISNTAGDTWHQAGTSGSFGANGVAIFYAYNTAGNASDVIQVNGWGAHSNINYWALVCLEFSGFTTTDPYETGSQVGASGSSTSLDSGNVVISHTNDVIVAMFEDDSNSLSNATYNLTPFNATGDPVNYFADGYHVVSASEHATATGSNASWYAYAAAFAGTGGGGPTLAKGPLANNPLKGCCRR